MHQGILHTMYLVIHDSIMAQSTIRETKFLCDSRLTLQYWKIGIFIYSRYRRQYLNSYINCIICNKKKYVLKRSTFIWMFM